MSRGGQTTSTTSIDPALRDAALENLKIAKLVGQLGFVPYTGATVAGMSPAQQAAMATTNQGAAAFGLTPSAVPTGGDMSPYAMYQAALANMAPGQRAFIESMFIDPMTGQMRGAATQEAAATAAPAAKPATQSTYTDRQETRALIDAMTSGGGRTTSRGGTGSFGLPDPMSGRFSGTNLPGAAGAVINRVTRAVAPKGERPAVVQTSKPKSNSSASASTSKSTTRGGNAGRR
jgi:hypothetical protein